MPWQAYLDMHSSFSIPLNVPSNDVSVAETISTSTKAASKSVMNMFTNYLQWQALPVLGYRLIDTLQVRSE